MVWADQHCHLPTEAGDAQVVVDDAYDAGVRLLINVGVSVDNSRQAIETASVHKGVWATAGVHPHGASNGMRGLELLIERPEVVAVGETGLDYHYDNSPRPAQRDMFAAHIELANDHDLALVVHSRSAWDDVFRVFDREGMPSRTVMHCFTGGMDEAQECLDRGAFLSFSGIITFANASEIRSAVKVCPLDRLMIETDSPYLAPVPHRGHPNRPALVPVIGEAVAKIQGLDVGEVEQTTWETSLRFYNIEDFCQADCL